MKRRRNKTRLTLVGILALAVPMVAGLSASGSAAQTAAEASTLAASSSPAPRDLIIETLEITGNTRTAEERARGHRSGRR